MRFMIMVRANATSEVGHMSLVDEGLMADMAIFHEEMGVGVLLDACGSCGGMGTTTGNRNV